MIWWIKHIAVCLLSGFFLLFGVQALIAAYRLNNPFDFVLCFFSSNLIILISATILFGFIYRMVWCRKEDENNEED